MRITAVLENVDRCDSTTFLLVVEKKRTGIVGKTFASSVLSEWILLEQMTEHLCTFWAELSMAGNCNVGDGSGFCGPNVANVPICQARFWPQGYRCRSNTIRTFSTDTEDANFTDRKLRKWTLMLLRMLNRAELVVHTSFMTPFAAIWRTVLNKGMFYIFTNFCWLILGIFSI